MFCLISSEKTADIGLLGRIKRVFSGSNGFSARETVVLGVRMLHITLEISARMKPDKVLQMIRQAAEIMREERVRQVLFAKNFPYRALVLREGFDEMESSFLIEKLAGRIAAQLSGVGKSDDVPGISNAITGKYAVVFTANLTVPALRTLAELCGAFKYLMVMTETNNGREFDAMRRRTGISVIEQPTSRQLQNADVAVIFGPLRYPVSLPEKCIVLGVGPGALEGVVCAQAVTGLTLELTDGRDDGLPEGFSREELLSLALSAGTLKPEEIIISDIAVGGVHTYLDS